MVNKALRAVELQSDFQPESFPKTDLRYWLDVAWFFPLGFRKEQIIESGDSFLCYGEREIYKFLKKPSTDFQTDSDFETKWKSAIREVVDNARFSPELYIGLRPLVMVDDGPVWLDIIPSSELSLKRAVPFAHDVAIVLRRIDEDATLGGFLSGEHRLSIASIKAIASSLVSFHRRAQSVTVQKIKVDPFFISDLYKKRYIAELFQFRNSFGSYIDPFSRLELTEAVTFLGRFIEQHEELFVIRAEQGLIIDAHGDLRSPNIVFKLHEKEEKKCSFFNRPVSNDFERVDDLLSDLASLAIDLEVRDNSSLARRIESEYAAQLSDVFDPEIYRFHLVAQALRQARHYFESTSLDSNDIVDVNKYLSRAFFYALNLTKPFMLAVVERGDGDGRELAASLSELIEVNYIEPQYFKPAVADCEMPRPLIYEKMLSCAGDLLAEGRSCVMLWDFLREEEILELRMFSNKYQIPCLFIQCEDQNIPSTTIDPDWSEFQSSMQIESIFPYWAENLESSPFNFLRLQPMMTQPEMALYVLTELRHLSKTE